MPAGRSDIFDDAMDVLSTSRDEDGGTNSLTAQLGDVGSEAVQYENARWIQHVGFASRPAKPAPKQAAAQAVCFGDSSNRTCIASWDTRSQQVYANLAEGETCMYGGGVDGSAQGRVMCKADGRVALITTSTNKPTSDASHPTILSLVLDPDPVHGGFVINAPWGVFRWGPEGLHITHASGARLDLGGIGGLSVAGVNLGSYIKMTAASIHINGSAVGLGPAPAANVCSVTHVGPTSPAESLGSSCVTVTP